MLFSVAFQGKEHVLLLQECNSAEFFLKSRLLSLWPIDTMLVSDLTVSKKHISSNSWLL